MKFNIGDEARFAIPAGQVGSFNPSEECADGDWSSVVYVSHMEPYINEAGCVVDSDSELGSYSVRFKDGESWWIPASFLFKAAPTLYLIRGVCGSGKSTLAQQLFDCGLVAAVYEADSHFVKEEGSYVFDPKQLSRAHSLCQARAFEDLKAGNSVAVSNTSTTEKEVAVYQQMAEELGAKFVSLVVESRHDGKNQHGVSEEKLQQMRNRFSVKL